MSIDIAEAKQPKIRDVETCERETIHDSFAGTECICAVNAAQLTVRVQYLC